MNEESTQTEYDSMMSLLDNTDRRIYVMDRYTWEILYANKTTLADKPSTDYKGHTCYEFVRGENAPCPGCVSLSVNNIPVDVDWHDVARDKYYHVHAVPLIWDGHDAIAQFITDTTVLKRENSSLELKGRNLENLVNNIPAGVVVFQRRDGAFQRIAASPHLAKILGLTLDEVSSETYEEFCRTVHPDDLFQVSEDFLSLTKGKLHTEVLCRLFNKRAQAYRWVLIQGNSKRQDDGSYWAYVSFTDVHNSKNAEEELRESREQYQLAIKAAQLTFWEYDIPNHRIIQKNEEFGRYNLSSVIDDIPESLLPYFEESDYAKLVQLYHDVDSGVQNASCDVWYKLSSNNSPHCERVSYTGIRDEHGVPLKAFGIGQDITLQKLNEEKYEHFIKDILTADPNSLCIFKLNFTENKFDVSQNSLKFTDFKSFTTIDDLFSAIADLIESDPSRKAFLMTFNRSTIMADLQIGKSAKSMDVQYIDQSEDIRWATIFLSLEQNPASGAIEGILRISDITESVQDNAIISRIVNEELDSISTINIRKGTIVFRKINKSAIPTTPRKYSSYEEDIRYAMNLVCNSEDYEDAIKNLNLKNIISELDRSESFTYACTIHDSRGNYFRKQLRHCYVDDSHREILVMRSDITADYLSQQMQLEKMEDAMKSANIANRSKTDFLSQMSHDIRTPMNGIIGMTRIAREYDNPPETADCLDKIETSGKFLLGLVNDILDMSKIENNKITLNPEPYPAKDFYNYLNAVIRPLTEGKRQRLQIEGKIDKTVIPLVDQLRLNQIFFNLLSNAVKYTPEGGTISLSLTEGLATNNKLHFTASVSDTGIGMSQEFQQILFDPFTQEGRSDISESRGTGLGLAIVKKNVDMLGGTITVDSKIGRGTTFSIAADFDYIRASDYQVRAAAKEKSAALGLLKGSHILLCEDHPLNREIAVHILQKAGAHVTSAEDGYRGFQTFADSENDYFDAILMDIRMPVMDGFEATSKIRALPRIDAKAVPIIAMTADTYSADIQKCFSAGMNAHVSKPVDVDTLCQTIADCIAKTR